MRMPGDEPEAGLEPGGRTDDLPTSRFPASAPPVIVLDGPAGSGKSTTARAVATRLGLPYLDTGAMYRSTALAALRAGIELTDAPALEALAIGLDLELVTDPAGPRVLLSGADVTEDVRSPEVTAAVSAVAAVPGVRAELVRRQRAAAGAGLVADGRDLGTVVFPDATVRVFLTADPAVRARRRSAQPEESAGGPADTAAVEADLRRRDEADSTRAADPLRPAEGALLIDNSDLSLDQVVRRIVTAAGQQDDPAGDDSTSTRAPVLRGGSVAPIRPKRWLFLLLRRPLEWLFRTLFRLRVEGAEQIPRSGPVLIIGNHSGFLDGPLVVVVTRHRRIQVLAKNELFSGPLGSFMRTAGQIPVRRGHPDRTALRACTRVLVDGGALAVFPEGTRGEGMLDQVRHGAAYVLIRSGLESVPIVPVVCAGTAEALPKGARFPKLRAPVRVVFGAPFTVPLPVEPHSRRAVAAVSEDMREHLAAHLEKVVPSAGTAGHGAAA